MSFERLGHFGGLFEQDFAACTADFGVVPTVSRTLELARTTR